jgi:sigma-54 dependent transcriptional regulator, acetoin dehydrogenase operon transcriptional activator AcoR
VDFAGLVALNPSLSLEIFALGCLSNFAWSTLWVMINSTSIQIPNARTRGVGQARQAVLDAGLEADLSGIQPWLARSWQRCLSKGYNPKTNIEFEAVSKFDCHSVLEHNQHLLGAAQTSIRRLAEMVSGLGYFALLTDARGVVVHVDGAIDRSEPSTALARVGVDLSEHAVGTSAICTALIERQAVWLHQGEHFYDRTSVFSCAGAPIFGPKGQLLGMLDLTGIRTREQSQLKHLVSQVATQIEHSLLFSLDRFSQSQCVVELTWPLGSYAGAATNQSGDALGFLRIDKDGVITGASATARQLFSELENLENQTVVLGDLFAVPDAEILEALGKNEWQKTVPLWSGLDVHLRRVDNANLVAASGYAARPLGALSSGAQTNDSVPIKQLESALIMKAVNETRGNIVEAARRLGLSRATVYRKLASKKK